jgi:hypothetical protein
MLPRSGFEPRDRMDCPWPGLSIQGYEDLDPLWSPYPISSKHQISRRHEALVAEYSSSRLSDDIAAQTAMGGVTPDSRLAKDLYSRLLHWKHTCIDPYYEEATMPSWVVLMLVVFFPSLKVAISCRGFWR